VAYWINIIYERDTYLIDLDSIRAFCFSSSNRRITFSLPDGGITVCLHPQSHPESYQKVLDYVEKIYRHDANFNYWVKFTDDRKEYLVDLNQIRAFSQDPKTGKISFWLPDNGDRIILHPQGNFEAYSKVRHYIEQKTGHSLH
jgi:hypothetical protein